MRTAIFLGAGASKSDGASLQNELLKDYFLMRLEKNKNGFTKRYQPEKDKTGVVQVYIEEIIKNFLIQYFGVDFNIGIENITFPTFEEILGLIDIAEIKGDKLKQKKEVKAYFDALVKELEIIYQDIEDSLIQEDIKNRVICNGRILKNFNEIVNEINPRQAIIFLMAEILEYKLHVNPQETNHYKLINKISDISNINFFSTNYDLLIDSALVNNGYNINYNIDERSKEKKNLFKLHGSLNLLYCPACKQIIIYGIEKAVAKLPEHHYPCLGCSTKLDSIIIAPTYLKEFKNPYLQRIWANAEVYLKQTEHIIFCGYSFPDADYHIKYLIKNCQINNWYYNLKKISIVNNFNNKSKQSIDEDYLRYKRFFGSHVDVVDTGLSFQEFCENPNSIL